MNENDCQIIEREVCYQGFYRLERLRLRHRLFAGGMSPAIVREVIEKGDVAAVLLYDPTRDEVVMIEQFRIGARNDPRGAMVAGDRRRPDRARRIARSRWRGARPGKRLAVRCSICCRSAPSIPARPRPHSARISIWDGWKVPAPAEFTASRDEGEKTSASSAWLPNWSALSLAEQGQTDSTWPLMALFWFARHRGETAAEADDLRLDLDRNGQRWRHQRANRCGRCRHTPNGVGHLSTFRLGQTRVGGDRAGRLSHRGGSH
jgi:hypothetical protein